MIKRQRRFTVAVALASVLALATACSSSEDASGVVTGSEPIPSNLKKSLIVVGQAIAMTGSNSAAEVGNVDVGQAWAQWVNDNGGINGHPVKVVAVDTKATATAASAAVETLVSEGIVAAVGSGDGLTMAVWAKGFADAKIPNIASFVANPFATADAHSGAEASHPYWYPITTGGAEGQRLAVHVAKANGATEFASVLCQEFSGCKTAGDVYDTEASKVGLSSAGFVQVASTATSYSAPCLTLKEKSPDYVQMGLTTEIAQRVISDCAAQGFNPAAYGFYGAPVNGPDIVPLSKKGNSLAGYIGAFPWYGTTPAIKVYQDVMKEYGKDNAVPESAAQAAAWAGFELFRKAMADVGDEVTAETVQAAMLKVKDETLGGLVPQPLTFTASEPRTLLTCAWPFKLDDGEFSSPETPTCL